VLGRHADEALDVVDELLADLLGRRDLAGGQDGDLPMLGVVRRKLALGQMPRRQVPCRKRQVPLAHSARGHAVRSQAVHWQAARRRVALRLAVRRPCWWNEDASDLIALAVERWDWCLMTRCGQGA
jgi:hypothetical protein